MQKFRQQVEKENRKQRIEDSGLIEVILDLFGILIIFCVIGFFARAGYKDICNMIKQSERPTAEYYAITVYNDEGGVDYTHVASRVSLTSSGFLKWVDIDTGAESFEWYTDHVEVKEILSDHSIKIITY